VNSSTSVPIIHHTTIYLFSAQHTVSREFVLNRFPCIMREMAFPRWPFNNTLCLWGVM
jgi:hypothetical protein